MNCAATIGISRNEALDLAIVQFSRNLFAEKNWMWIGDGQVLDDVMVLGYPRIPGFISHLAAEKATVAARLEVSKGKIASSPFEIFAKSELLLISAKVRGGFSGGPVLNTRGVCVGLISRSPAIENGSQSDDLGYGTAIPGHLISSFVSDFHAQNETSVERIPGSNFEWEDFSD
jgi:serine protease Do